MILKVTTERTLSNGKPYVYGDQFEGWPTLEQQKLFEQVAEQAFGRAEKKIQRERTEQPQGASAPH